MKSILSHFIRVFRYQKLFQNLECAIKIFRINFFLNILNLPIPLNFIHPKIRITNLDEHTFLCLCWLFTDSNVKPFSQTFSNCEIPWSKDFKMGYCMFIALPVLRICILNSRNRWCLRNFPLKKFQSIETKSLISAFSKLVFKYIFYNILWPTGAKLFTEPSKWKASRVKKVKK